MSNHDKLRLMKWAYSQKIKQGDKINQLNKDKEYAAPIALFNDTMPAQNEIMPSYTALTRNNQAGSFHKAIGPVLVVGQLFGLMPVRGVMERSASCLSYVFMSWRVFYALVCMLGGCIFTCLCVARLFTFGIKIQSVSSLIFYSSTFLTSILFYRLASRWPNLCRAIEHEESKNTSNSNQRTTLSAHFRLLSIFFLVIAIAEHISCILSVAATVRGCDRINPFLVGYYTYYFPQVFAYTDYNHWKAFFIQVHFTISSFNSNYIDLFIILMSTHLSRRFEVLNSSISAAKGKHLPDDFWKVARNNFVILAQLVGQIDKNINEIILLSFANNLFMICVQLFNSLNAARDDSVSDITCWKKIYKGLFTTTYFVFSFVFLISRFLAVAFKAARINARSREPLDTLLSVRSENYCTEVQRFIKHMTSDVVALTGLKFFYITRGLILSIAGTVVTYELVLVQFNQPSPSVHANITVKDKCGGMGSIST